MSELAALLQEGRRRELEQSRFYRLLSGDAERAGNAGVAERLNDLLADEQHHVSRLTARLLELGAKPDGGRVDVGPVPGLDAWEREARRREEREVEWYESALSRVEDPDTAALLRGILASERHHEEHLSGKWMPAGPTTSEEGA
ncbi:MAG: ferritin-like domain-containing protein [Longimicrobiales bacterium]|nr:ferritin-like domain-containing protein [Longimicrobiales bacterium]